ncbi:MAG: DUF3426 domain-containing protein, partial [Halomonadaceae bacterium]
VPSATREENTPPAYFAPPPELEEEHLIKHHPEHAAPPPEPEEEFLFEDNPEEDATEQNYTGRSDAMEEEFSSSFLSLDEEPQWYTNPEEPLRPSSVDESWADSLLDDVDDSWANSLLDDNDDSSSREKTPAQPPATADTAPEQPDSPSLEDDGWGELVDWDSLDDFPATKPAPEETPPAGDDHREPSPATANTLSEQPAMTPAEASGDWRQLQAEPIAASPVQTSHRFRWWWRGLALLLTAILLLQITWVQRDQLASNSLLRPVYNHACDLLNCQLPPLVDRSQLTSRDLVVRSHPESPGALLVEARLHNRASFPQPLPAVALSFSNLNGDIIAQRVFRPSEYLAGDQPATEIGPNRALPIKLSLQDPGREAINYRLDFLSLPQ